MIDAAYLPGLATHLLTASGDATACGMSRCTIAPEDRAERLTTEWRKVTCLRCRRTMLWIRLQQNRKTTYGKGTP